MSRRVVSAVIAAVAIGGGAVTYAAEGQTGGSKAPQGMGDKGGMQGMQGMMGMMHECQGMMGGGGMMGRGMSGGVMPQLPPGNEKLQLQMWAEMMQKMGEIAGKYAGQVK
jgi:hypothetical protein